MSLDCRSMMMLGFVLSAVLGGGAMGQALKGEGQAMGKSAEESARVPEFVPRALLQAAGCEAERPAAYAPPEGMRLRSVNSAEALRQAAANARAGDLIEIADGEYRDVRVVVPAQARGEEMRPVVIRAQHPGKVVFMGQSHFLIQGQYVVLAGLAFSGANVPWGSEGATYGTAVQLDGEHNRVTDCRFDDCGDAGVGWRHIVHMPETAKYNRVDSCRFVKNRSIPAGLHDGKGPVGNRFDHNYIDGNNTLVEKNWRVAIQIGQGARDETGTVVEYNTVQNFDGPESIGIKGSKCIVRNNLIRDCAAPLGVRAGQDCEIRGNVILHSVGGIMVTGSGHLVEGNCVVADRAEGGLAPVFLHCEAYKDGKPFYEATTGCTIRGNILAVLPANRVSFAVQSFAWLDDVRGTPRGNRFEDNLIISHRGGAGLIGCWDDSKRTTAEEFVRSNTFVNNRFRLIDAQNAEEVRVTGGILGQNGNRAVGAGN